MVLPRQSFAALVFASSVVVIACGGSDSGGSGGSFAGASGASAGGKSGAKGGSDGEGEAGAGGKSDGKGGGTAQECVSDVPCSNDVQCSSLPGYACNTKSTPKMCQRLSCGEEVPCSNDDYCTKGRVCRTIDHADGLKCYGEDVTPEECVTSCLTAPINDDAGCPQPIKYCNRLCAKLPEVCKGEGGFRHVVEIYSCTNDPFPQVQVGSRCNDGSSENRTVAY